MQDSRKDSTNSTMQGFVFKRPRVWAVLAVGLSWEMNEIIPSRENR